MSSSIIERFNGATGVKYGTPKDVVVDNNEKFMNNPIAIPKNPAKEPKKYINKS